MFATREDSELAEKVKGPINRSSNNLSTCALPLVCFWPEVSSLESKLSRIRCAFVPPNPKLLTI